MTPDWTHKKSSLQFVISRDKNSYLWEEGSLVRPKLGFLTCMYKATCERKLLLHITLNTPYWKKVVGKFCLGECVKQGQRSWLELRGMWIEHNTGNPKRLVTGCNRLEMQIRFTFKQNNVPKHTWFGSKHIHVLKWPIQNLDPNHINHLGQELQIYFHRCFLPKLTNLIL